ncbi:carboxylating nicotinate-nucleotide diphosphorylase [bacterium]|nr:carboxylating nicotinate-nucleotide diphosphorylase [bacterium]
MATRPLEVEAIDRLVALALEEDLGERGDVTGRIVPSEARARGRLVARQEGTIAGLALARDVLLRVEPGATFEPAVRDGERVSTGALVATIEGPARGVLAAERTMLNFLQRLSGIATATRRFVDAISGTGARIYDTRKTPPGWRVLSKYAVRCGGGESHRIGLHDQVLVKDNHLVVFGGEPAGISPAVAASRRTAPPGTPVEIEVTTLAGALAAASAGADIILLDNMREDEMARAVLEVRRAKPGRAPALEASGGVTLENVRRIAETGVDRISVGWITHSAPALDLALDFELESG